MRELVLKKQLIRQLLLGMESFPHAAASRGRPCHTHHCSDGLPCTGSKDACP